MPAQPDTAGAAVQPETSSYDSMKASTCELGPPHDVCFQLVCQSHAHRVVLAHTQYAAGCWPPGLRASDGVQATELGPRTDKRGPCLVLFTGVTATPAAINAWLPASSTGWGAVVVRAFYLGAPGRPCCTASSLEQLVAQVSAAGLPGPGSLRLHCTPKSLESWLAPRLDEQAFPLAVTGASHVLQAVQVEESCWRWNLHPPEQLYNYSPTLQQRVPGQLSKAAGKLTEALAAAGFQPSPDGVAVDVGAAPGGWTAVLAQRIATVIAIDPAALDERALQPNVHHLRCKVEDAAERVAELAGGHPLELLCCDANIHAAQGMNLLLPLMPLLRPGGIIVCTLKFCGSGRGKLKWLPEAEAALGAHCRLVEGSCQMLWLLANTHNERVIVARKAA